MLHQDFSNLQNLEIPRALVTNAVQSIQLHAFSDASKKAYAAVIYVRVTDVTKNVTVTLPTAKSKVAPVKTISMPRVEP